MSTAHGLSDSQALGGLKKIPRSVLEDLEAFDDEVEKEVVEEPPVISCLDALKGPLLTSDLTRVTGDILEKTRLIGIYFSASWCPPCRQFTSVLAAAHRQIRSKFGSKAWEIVLVPRDNKEADWKDYFADMPWLSLPFGHHNVLRLLDFFAIERIPRLCVVDSHGVVVCDDARGGMGFGYGLSPIAAYEWLASKLGFAAQELVVPEASLSQISILESNAKPPGKSLDSPKDSASASVSFKGARSPGSTSRSTKSDKTLKRGKSSRGGLGS